ncbi:hypothetical protein BDR26DRAFT_852893, partial [Obelidium mucronatum]
MAAVNAPKVLPRCDPSLPSGTYTISLRGSATPSQVYCNNAILGGGWMSFASAPADHWFSGRSTFTNPTTWSTNAYSYNNQSYSPSGLSGDYWIDVSAMGFNEILMMTGNGKYWISFEVGVVAIGSVGKCFAVESSGNFPVSLEASQLNYKET